MVYQKLLHFETSGRNTYDITAEISQVVAQARIITGLCHLSLQHTSASLILCENVDPVVRKDLERYLTNIVPDGNAMFKHTAEGDDDMPAHIRTILTGAELTIPITHTRLALGTWQGVYLYEHRKEKFQRKLTVTVLGE